MESHDRIIELETKISHLENFIEDLNEAFLAQEKTIKKLSIELEELRKQFLAGKEPAPVVEKPPHY